MAIPSGAFPVAPAGGTSIYPVGSSGNTLQATGFIPGNLERQARREVLRRALSWPRSATLTTRAKSKTRATG